MKFFLGKISVLFGLAALAFTTGCAGDSETASSDAAAPAPAKQESAKTAPAKGTIVTDNGNDGWFDNIPAAK